VAWSTVVDAVVEGTTFEYTTEPTTDTDDRQNLRVNAGARGARMRWLSGGLILAAALAACGSDAAYEVRLHNATDSAVVVQVSNTTTSPQPSGGSVRRIGAGLTFTDLWWAPFGNEPPAVIRAEDPGGTLLFCRRFTYAEIQKVAFRVEIVRGDIQCGR
jgi:hypothetical protein